MTLPESHTEVSAALLELLAGQTPHSLVPLLTLADEKPDSLGRYCMRIGGGLEWMTLEAIVECFQARETSIENSELDRYAYGFWLPTWQENLWEIARLRVENPGKPITFLCAGSNGSSKSEFAAAVMVTAMMQTESLPRRKAEQPVFWCLAETEPKSEAVEQPKIYAWLPSDYKTVKGSVKKTARGKLGYNDAGGFTDNTFSLYHGGICRFRFWSAAPDAVLEGPRPLAAWSDEELPFYWLEQIEKRLLTEAEHSVAIVPKLKMLLAQRDADPLMPFPRDMIGQLMMGVHLLTYTAKNGYTETVRAFMDRSRVVQEIEADPTLLPRRDSAGNIVGGEWMPKLVHCKSKHRRVRFMHAWENPLGGNWEAMRETAKEKGRAEILWWCYGVAEKSSDTPFPNFDVRIHVRPALWCPPMASWFNIVDPNATGGRQWFMLWACVVGQHYNDLAPGDIWVAREWPQRNDAIPTIGRPGEWARPGGKNGMGLRGSAQSAWPVGIQWRAEEIKRVERELALAHGRPPSDIANWEVMKHFIPEGNRIMDARPLNTQLAGQTETKTLFDYLEENELSFYGAGRDSGASTGETIVKHGLMMVNNALYFNRDHAVLNPKTGWLEINPQLGRGPRLRIADCCENLIDSIVNLPGDASPDSAWKDPIDCLRYLIIADPQFISEQDQQGYSPGGSY
jgi:hypothetical protein